MPDDPKKTGLDHTFIALEEPHEVRSWTESFGCSEEELRGAVKAVGNSVERVRHHLALRTVVKRARYVGGERPMP